jgi:hypothetical protein
MPIKLNQTLPDTDQSSYNNDIKIYAGFYFDTLSIKTTPPTDSPWTSITVNESNGYMLAVSNTGATTGSNALVYSTNGGETWANISLTTATGTNNWRGVTFGAGIFVAVTASGATTSMRTLYTSGTTPTTESDFTFATGMDNNNWESVTYGNGYFVAVSSSGSRRIMSSTNGISWTMISQTNINSISWDSITYSPELKRFVIVSNDGSGSIAYADFNPTSWTLSSKINTYDLSTINFVLNTVIWSSKLKSFIAAGNNGKILSSPDGIRWGTVAFSGTNNFSSIIWSQELELIILIATTGSGANLAFTGHSLSPSDPNIWTNRNLINANNWTTGVWNRKYGGFAILSSTGTNTRILVSKIAGLNHFLDKRFYYDLIDVSNLNNFSYYNNLIRTSVGKSISIFPTLNELYGFTFFIEDTLPSGLSLNSFTGEISGTATTVQSLTNHKISARSGTQVLTADLYIYISQTIEQLLNLTYSNDNIYTDLVDQINLYPIITQGTDYTFSFQLIGVNNFNSFPRGMDFNYLNGIISGIPQTVQPTIGYLITATNSLGSISKKINLTVYILKTTIQGGDSRGTLEKEGEWQGYVSYFYSIPNVIGGKIEKNYFYDVNGRISFNSILTLATRRSFYQIDGVFYYKKELIFTVTGNYGIDNWESLTLNSDTFTYASSSKQIDSNGNTQFIWTVNDTINYFPIKDNTFFITGKDTISLIAPSGLNYTSASTTTLVENSISFTPSLSFGDSINFSISPALPTNYLSFNSTSGTISGITTPFSSDVTYTVRASNRSGFTTTNFRIRNIYSNTNINTGYNNINGIINEGYISGSIGSIVNNSFGSSTIESAYYQWTTAGQIFYFIISGSYYFPETNLKSIDVNNQTDSTKFIVRSSNYNSGTGRGYNYTSYDNYIISNKLYSRWIWTFPGQLQSDSNANIDYGWALGANFTPPSTYNSQTISIFIE